MSCVDNIVNLSRKDCVQRFMQNCVQMSMAQHEVNHFLKYSEVHSLVDILLHSKQIRASNTYCIPLNDDQIIFTTKNKKIDRIINSVVGVDSGIIYEFQFDFKVTLIPVNTSELLPRLHIQGIMGYTNQNKVSINRYTMLRGDLAILREYIFLQELMKKN